MQATALSHWPRQETPHTLTWISDLAFLREHRAHVSSLSLQEGAKYLSASQRRALGLPAEASWIERERRRKVAGAR